MKDIDKKMVGLRIRSIRQDKGMTLEEFGKLFGAGKSNVSKWEKGLAIPNAERLKSISKIGNMTVDQLLYGENGKSYYNWSAISEFISGIFNSSVDKIALEKTQKIIDKAFFLKLGLEDIVNIYMFQENSLEPLETLGDLQDYFEQSAEGFSSYLGQATGEELMDLELQISFFNSYSSKIKKYRETGEWTSNRMSNLKEK